MIWRRSPTIGDLVADSIAQTPRAWAVQRTGPFTWTYANAAQGWRLSPYSDARNAVLSFDQCSLTWRERGRVLKALGRWNAQRRQDARQRAMRRVQLRIIG